MIERAWGPNAKADISVTLEPPSAGVVFWSWDHIEADPEKAAVIRSALGAQVANRVPFTLSTIWECVPKNR